ncbi:isochorismatase family protein [Microbacterium sp. HD4P20]|uniref:isochorismatase family protein n=1 Tax=Microbacterium sp. HD4P20 TaxID=2864874 RepID=UPI001C644323|nr:isochorismatase family protein [Microbacterium sp. HD4P20]MCP2636589.1 isochorismatase family protein [Microbacterium sp. HD4P20]
MTDNRATALLIVDAQESFRQRADDWARTANPQVLSNISRLVEDARSSGELVVWVTHAEPGTGGVFDPELGFVEVMSELQPAVDDLRLTKTTINAFSSTDLEEQLKTRGVGTVVVCGIRTEQCCETTARIAGDLGFDVVFVTDATTTSSIPATETYGAVSGAELMQRTQSILGARGFAAIETTSGRVAARVAA